MTWKLQTQDGEAVTFPFETEIESEPVTITGGEPPHKVGSTGRIFTDQGEFYPSVADLVWVEVPGETKQAGDPDESPTVAGNAPDCPHIILPSEGAAFWLAPIEDEDPEEFFLWAASLEGEGRPLWDTAVFVEDGSIDRRLQFKIEAALWLMEE